jgi:hypothetical protein
MRITVRVHFQGHFVLLQAGGKDLQSPPSTGAPLPPTHFFPFGDSSLMYITAPFEYIQRTLERSDGGRAVLLIAFGDVLVDVVLSFWSARVRFDALIAADGPVKSI